MRQPTPLIRKKHLEPLRPILGSWYHVLKTYIKRVEGDLPFWYLERPQVGFLAIAAWRTGWAALEEWGTKKSSQRNQLHGRNDLWIGRGKIEFFIESKHTWCDIHNGKAKMKKALAKALVSAEVSAKELTCEPPAKKIAAVFVTPIWKGKDRKRISKDTQEWINSCKGVGADAVALVVLDERDKRGDGEKGERYIGSALLLLSVK